MAEAASDLVSFDIIHGIILDSGENILEDLNEEEQLEVENVVTLLESVKDNSLEDFETDENNAAANRHKNVSESELDRLAGKNTAQATAYQTKWAVVVMKDEYYCLFTVIFHETW